MKILLVTLLLVYLNQFASAQDTLPPPIPTQKLSPSLEIRYIFKTDQDERAFMYDSTKKFDLIMDFNDSIRLTRIIELDKAGLLKNDLDKYYAVWIYHHEGDTRMTDDSSYYQRELALCDEIMDSGSNEFLSDTISSSDIKKLSESDFSTFIKLYKTKSKIDTLIDYKTRDTSLIMDCPVKELASTLMQLAQNRHNNENKESFNLNDLDKPENRQKMKAIIKEKIITGLKEKSPEYLKMLTDEDIDKMVEQNFQYLINTRNSMMEELKKKTGINIENENEKPKQ